MDYPFISAMIVTYNEELSIQKCLSSLLTQTYPCDLYEVLIIDGKSTDRTVELAKQTEADYIAECKRSRKTPVSVRYFQNDKRILAAGWNIGIREAVGNYVVRIDAHAYADERFLELSVDTMFSVKDAVCVGGTIVAKGLSQKGKIVEHILSSPFGVGGARFRYSKKSGYVDTVAYGLYRKEIFERLGYFDETLERTQDNDMHRRIRDAKEKFYLNPEIKTVYLSRDSVRKMLRQGFNNGKWIMINFKKRPGKIAIRHFVPLCFILTFLLFILMSFFNKWFFVVGLCLLFVHLLMGLCFSFKKTKNISYIIKMPFLFLFLHICYGIGSIAGLFYKFDRNRMDAKNGEK